MGAHGLSCHTRHVYAEVQLQPLFARLPPALELKRAKKEVRRSEIVSDCAPPRGVPTFLRGYRTFITSMVQLPMFPLRSCQSAVPETQHRSMSSLRRLQPQLLFLVLGLRLQWRVPKE